MTRDQQAENQATGANGSANPDERTGLLENAQNHVQRIGRTNSGTPYYKHSNPVIRYPSTVLHTVWQVLLTNYVNVLLVFVPLGIVAGLAEWSPVLQFVLNFIAIIPLASLLAFATEELAIPLGQTLGGLLNATFGNAVELIVSELEKRLQKLTMIRSVSLPCALVKSVSSRPVCLDQSSRISFLSLDAVFSQED